MGRTISTLKLIAWSCAPVVLTLVVMTSVVSWGNGVDQIVRTKKPVDKAYRNRCSWRCHDRGCRHEMRVVGPPIAGPLDRKTNKLLGLYGWTIASLHSTGSYRFANLILFCLVWPLGTGALWVVVVRQRLAIRALRVGPESESASRSDP